MVDRDELESCLQQRPREDAQIIAQRAAIRAMPFYYSYLDERPSISEFQPALPILRCLLVAGVSREFAEPEYTSAAERAVSSIQGVSSFLSNSSTYAATLAAEASSYGEYSIAYSASDAAEAATLASEASAVLAQAFSDAVVRDLQESDSAVRLLRASVWHDDTPELWHETEQRALKFLAIETGDANSFWHRWWRGAVSGQWLDWNLQRDVALIPDDIWQQGPKAVAAAIAEIEARYALALTDNAETIEPDPETGRLILVPTSALPPDLGHYARRKMLKAVALVEDPACLQMYGGLSADLAMLRDAVADAANMPVELYDACASATRRLAVRAANGECPPPDKDAVLSDYLTRLREVAADILSHDPATQSVLERRNAITGNTALIDSAVAVQQATAELLRVTAGHLAKSLPKDAALATDPTANPDDRKAAAFRWAGRFLRIGAWCVGASVGATYALGQTIVLAKDVLEALPIIQASPYYQQALAAVLRLLNLG